MSSTTTATTTADSGDAFEGLAARVDAAIAAISDLEPAAREKAEAVKESIEAFHKAGLTAIVKALKADPRGKELLFALVDDPTVHALLALHGIIRQPSREEPAPPSQPLELVQIQLPGARPLSRHE